MKKVVLSIMFLGVVVAPVPSRAATQEIVQPDGSLHHQFGWSVAVEGNTLVIGDPDYIREDMPCVKERGAVEIYSRVDGVWQRSQFFRYIGDGSARTRLGYSVAIKGNTIIASTPGQDFVGGGTTVLGAGAISVYRRPSATAPFAFAGHAFAPTPIQNGDFSSIWPVATNGLYMAATGFPSRPGDVEVYSLANDAITHVSTIATSLPLIASLAITDQNVLVATSGNDLTPVAYALNGTQALTVDTSSLADTTSHQVSSLIASGNTIAYVRKSNTSTLQQLVLAKLGANGIQSTQLTTLPSIGQDRLAQKVAMKEGEGIVIDYSGLQSALLYVGGSYRNMGALPDIAISTVSWSLAFSGTDLFLGEDVDHNDPTQLCGRVGSVLVSRPLLGVRTALRMAPLAVLRN